MNNTPNHLERLAEKCSSILLAEIGAWLHMLGKYDWRFIEEHCGGTQGYDYQNFFTELQPDYPDLFSLFDPSLAVPKPFPSNRPLTVPNDFCSFVKDHRETTKARKDDPSLSELAILMIEGHGRGSVIEKGILADELTKQKLPDVHINTAFGFSKKLTSADYKTKILRDNLNTFFRKLIPDIGNANKDVSWNEYLLNLKCTLRDHFAKILAETRRPTNDVTLMDQTTAAVAFFKAALAERAVVGSWKPLMDSNKPQYRWRVLSISVDTTDYLIRALKLPDLLSRKERIEKAQERTCQLIEIDYPLGTEIYRDQSVVAFLVPGEGDLLNWTDKVGDSLKQKIERIYIEQTDGEITVQLKDALMTEGSRNVYKFGDMLNKPISGNIPDLGSVKSSWQSKIQVQICSNCQLHPQGPSEKAQSQNICDTCLNKRVARSENWYSSRFHSTVWIDEAADNNARLALLVSRFELENWLNGLLWNSVISILDLSYNNLFTSVQRSFGQTKKGNYKHFDSLLAGLITNEVRQQYDNQFEPYFNDVIWPDWENLILNANLDTKARITAIHLLRQTPSFARIRRVWETTRQFFCSVREKIESGDPIPRIAHRLIIKGTLDSENLDSYQAYDIRINGIKTSFVWDSQRFISTDNLQYLAKQLGKKKEESVSDCLKRAFENQKKQGGLTFYKERESGGTPVPITTLKDFIVEEELHNYTPTVSILTEPQLFMTLIPADKAMDIVQHIQTEYEVQFSKVRNRLPLHLSLVFFHRRLPLYAAMDAARKMLNRKSNWKQIWLVEENLDVEKASPEEIQNYHLDERLGKHVRKLRLKETDPRKAETPDLFISYSFGDDSEDYHYPYFYTESVKFGDRKHQFSAPLPDDPNTFKELVHVSELKKGDTVYYTPSTFDFEFLDTTARRFEVQYEKGRRTGPRSTRPYFLEQVRDFQKIWDLLSGRSGKKGLTNTQIKALDMLIENRRGFWGCTEEDSTFQQFVEDSLKNIDKGKNSWWKNLKEEERKLIRRAAIGGMLADVLEIYMEIMKQKSKWE
jgi:CRISPR-associated Csx11 family protein